MYTTTQDTLDMIRDYLDGTLTRADAEGWAELEDFARSILGAALARRGSPMNRPTFDIETAYRAELINWLLDNAERSTLEEWADLWLDALSSDELRQWVRDALPLVTPDTEVA